MQLLVLNSKINNLTGIPYLVTLVHCKMYHRALLLLVVLLTVKLNLSTQDEDFEDDFDERSPKKSKFISGYSKFRSL